MKKGDRVAQLVGWEPRSASRETPRSRRAVGRAGVRRQRREADRTYATTIYTAPKGNLVFNAGTCWWNVVLSSPPGFQNPPRKDFRRNNVRIQRITKNILDRMMETKPAQ